MTAVLPIPELAIIVPMRNEIGVLPELLDHLARWQACGCEVLIVDGGSTDGSVEAVQAAGLPLIRAAPGRAGQMNAGAKATDAGIMLFLHADTRLPTEADRQIIAALMDGQVWGRFDVRIAGRPRMLRMVATMINLRSRWTGIATGDQAMFVRRGSFAALGGFAQLPLMEDIDLSRRLGALSRPACLRAKVQTSGRRWESRGVWRTILLMWRLRLAYWLGVSPERLAEAYR